MTQHFADREIRHVSRLGAVRGANEWRCEWPTFESIEPFLSAWLHCVPIRIDRNAHIYTLIAFSAHTNSYITTKIGKSRHTTHNTLSFHTHTHTRSEISHTCRQIRILESHGYLHLYYYVYWLCIALSIPCGWMWLCVFLAVIRFSRPLGMGCSCWRCFCDTSTHRLQIHWKISQLTKHAAVAIRRNFT